MIEPLRLPERLARPLERGMAMIAVGAGWALLAFVPKLVLSGAAPRDAAFSRPLSHILLMS